MSSTKRGSQRSEADFYRTPHWCVWRLLDHPVMQALRPSTIVYDPCAGVGDIGAAITEHPSSRAAPRLRGNELQPEFKRLLCKNMDEVRIADYLTAPPWPYGASGTSRSGASYSSPNWIITNPPFSLAMPMIEKALTETRNVAMLLRLNFLSSAKRYTFFRTHMPDLYVLPNRPSFQGTGTTDSIEYAWFVWHESHVARRKSGLIELLDHTADTVRHEGLLRPLTAAEIVTMALEDDDPRDDGPEFVL